MLLMSEVPLYARFYMKFLAVGTTPRSIVVDCASVHSSCKAQFQTEHSASNNM